MTNKLALSALLIALLALGAVFCPAFRERGAAGPHEAAYERIMRTKTIRCAYETWPPFLSKDPTTGKISGVYFDLLERWAHDLGLKIDWAEEVGAADQFEGLRTGRVDLFCSAVTVAPERTLVASFSKPIGYDPFYLYARAGDTRFDHAYEKANSDKITMITLDGYFGAIVTREEFPKAKVVSLPNLTSDIETLVALGAGKADTAVCDSIMAQEFMKQNPGKVRQVAGPPVRFPALVIPYPLGETKLGEMLNASLTYYQETGVIEKILLAHNLDPAKFLRPALPYEAARAGR